MTSDWVYVALFVAIFWRVAVLERAIDRLQTRIDTLEAFDDEDDDDA